MAPLGTLIGPMPNPRNFKARIVAVITGLELGTTPDFQMGVDNKTPEYLAKYPAGKVPVFEGADGFSVSDSSAIAYYIAAKAGSESTLLGQTAEETAEILQFILFAEADFVPALIGTLAPLMGHAKFFKPAHQQAEEQFFRFIDVLNTQLINRTFVVGERLTIADVVVACDLLYSFQMYLTSEDRDKYPDLTRYFTTITAEPAFKAVLGDVVLCDKRIELAAQ
ncbi:glutathione S-transferase [Kickxella alabastrina]|uniref:glutathione S-transferase n=1 Tax=Kickxella alabastrina TaxID=61397 RepID=UPI002220EC57|nr:glutathione S-transferase [Kickxella alabastrina]KAI7834435.1 glutathione S-transferase [Kickxella alabastrina]